MDAAFVAQSREPGDSVKLLMYERNQLREGAFVALPPLEKQSGDL